MALFLRTAPLLQLNAKAAQTTAAKQLKQTNLVLTRQSSVSHAGSSHWNAERYLSLALLGIIPAALIMENQVGDFVLASSLILHSWWGLNQIVTDYLHGPTLPKIGFGVLTATCLVALVGMLYFNYADMGLAKALKKLWSL